MKVILRNSALEDLDRIHAWISKDNPPAAAGMVARIRDRARSWRSTHLLIWDAQGL